MHAMMSTVPFKSQALRRRCHGIAGENLTWFALLGCLAALLAGCSQHAGPPLSKTAAAADSGGLQRSAEHGSEPSTVQALSVQTAVPARQDLVAKFEQAGPVVAFEQADLYARVGGYVKRVNVDLGDRVEAGQVLLELDVPDLIQDLSYKDALVRKAQADHELAKAAIHAADAALITWQAQLEQTDAEVKKAESERQFREQQARRYAELAQLDATTPALAEEKKDQHQSAIAAYDSAVSKRKAMNAERASLLAKLEAAKADLQSKARQVEVSQADRNRTQVLLDYSTLKAPFRGVITRRTLDEGALVNAGSSGNGEPIFTLARIDKVIVVLRVPEREVGYVRLGARASMELNALPGRDVSGTVSRFAHALEDKSRTMRVEIDIDNPQGVVYPGMYGPVTLVLQEIKNALTIPASAVYAVGGTSYVIQVRDNRAHRVAVKTGYDDGKVVQVLEGLSDGDEIIVSNKGQIAEGQEIQPHRIDLTEAAP